MLAREIHEDDDKHTSRRLGHFQPERDQPAGEGGIKNTVPVVYVALTYWPGVGRLFGQPARLPVTA
jgi:hypothetical protein